MHKNKLVWKGENETFTILQVNSFNKDEDLPECKEFIVQYENRNFKGCDRFVFYKQYYNCLQTDLNELKVNNKQTAHIDDHSKQIDGYINLELNSNELIINGVLGKSTNCNRLNFEFVSSATLLNGLIDLLLA